MKSLDRYITRQLVAGTLMVAAGLTGVIWLIQSLRIIELIVTRGLSLTTFLTMTLLLLPNFLVIILPISLFAVVLFTYNKLIVDRELVIMRTAGLSNWSISSAALLVALLTSFVSYALNLYITPEAYKQFRMMQWDIRQDEAQIFLREGVFNEIRSGVMVFVQERSASGELIGIMVHDSRDDTRPTTYIASRGALIQTATGPRVVLGKGSIQRVEQPSNRYNFGSFDSYTLEFGGSGGKEQEERYREPRERSIGELFSVTPESVGERDFGRMRVEAHRRIYTPLSVFAYTLIGLALLLTGQFSRRGHVERVLLAVGMVIFLMSGDLGLSTLAAKNLALVPLLYIAAVIPIILAVLLIHSSSSRLSPPRLVRVFLGGS
ncbi:MAG: LPS export ABC transporter permease LptF [Rhodospirillales bacterium]